MGQAVSKILSQPYSAIAPYYDVIMKDIDYDGWLRYIHQIFKKLGHKPHKILDLACGSGTCAVSLSKQGYEVLGIDRSDAMLHIAREKSRTDHLPIEYMRQNMEHFSLPLKVDTIISLFDSLNNILDEQQLLNVYRCAFGALQSDGLFIFDMNTEYGLGKGWGMREIVREDENIVSIWRNSYDSPRRTAKLELTLFVPEGNHHRRIDEIHMERAYPLPRVRKLLKEAGFVKIHFYRHLTFRVPDSVTKRVMIIGKRPP